MVFPFHSL